MCIFAYGQTGSGKTYTMVLTFDLKHDNIFFVCTVLVLLLIIIIDVLLSVFFVP